MDPKTQVEAARGSALAIPTALATLVVTGADRLTWLNGLVTCDLAKRQVGEATYGLVVGKNGRAIADVFVLVDETRLLLALPAVVVEKLRAHFEHYLVMEDAEVAPASDAYQTWLFHGPRSAELLTAARRAGGVGAAFDRTGLGGAIVFGDRERKDELSRAIGQAAQEIGGVIGDADGWHTLRLERAVPEFGEDFDEKTYPQEAGLERVAVSFEKGCYLGQEVVCMLEMRGHVNRKLTPLVLEGAVVPSPGTRVADLAGDAVGDVSSAAFSPTLGRVVAFAMVKRAQVQPANLLLVGGARAQVVDRPT